LSRLAHTRLKRETPIYLWGHSLGARVIHWSLLYNDWQRYNLRDVVLMAGATDASDSANWKCCAAKVRGCIYNCLLNHDVALHLKKIPDLLGLSWEQCIGHTPIDEAIKNIKNIRFPFGLFGHNSFKAELSEIARQTVPHLVGSWNYHREFDFAFPTELFETRLTGISGSASESIGDGYVGLAKSKVFHRPECKTVNGMADRLVTFATREEAVATGKKPCARCKP
jgi:hypothetical protein